MARNRKYQSAAIRFGPALKAFLLCLLIAGSGVGYVWQKSQINELGKQLRSREQQLANLDYRIDQLRKQLGSLRSPESLQKRIKELNLGLAAPLPSQIWRLNEPQPDAPVLPAERERQYATQTPIQ
jgi:hypothetical protein